MAERDHDSATAVQAPARSLRLPGVRVSVVSGPDQGKSATATRGTLRIGTARDNDLVLGDDAVSRRHLELRLGQSSVRVVDLGSTNGTRVDGVRIADAYLSESSRIAIGGTLLRATAVDEPVTVALSPRDRFGGLYGASVAMREVFAVLEKVAPTEATVVLEGETGTGKEVAAEALVAASARKDGPLVAIDCGAIPANLIESELFGHVKGAFTGAIADRVGIFEQAHGGTLFLDEIGELPLELQPKLLRALEKRQVRRVGDKTARDVDVRVIAATSRDLPAEVNAGRFREDLYFRLAVVRVVMPPLRERLQDVPALVRHFVALFAPARIDEAALIADSLAGRTFPGNVRELRNLVERALALGPGARATPPQTVEAGAIEPRFDWPFKQSLAAVTDAFEKRYLEHALRKSGGSVSAAARLAGLSRRYVQTLMVKHALRQAEDDE